MKVVFLTQYYFPEESSSEYLFNDVLNLSRELGNNNIIIAPNPVRGLSNSEIKKYSKQNKTTLENSDVIYRGNVRFKAHNKISRVLRMFSTIKYFAKKLKEIDFDIVVVPSNPPLFLIDKINKVAQKKGAKVIYNIHDIYPDNIKKIPMIRKFLANKSVKSFNGTETIAVLSKDMKNTIVYKGIDEGKITVIPSWEYNSSNNEELLYKIPDENKVNVFYIGNIGEWQNIRLIIDAFKYIDERHSIHIVGGGRKEKWLAKEVDKINDSRLTYTKRIPINQSVRLYSLADANLITLDKGIIFTAYPSKTQNCISANKPIIAALDEESNYAKNIKSFKNGFVVDPINPMKLAVAINKIEKNQILDEKYHDIKDIKETSLQKWAKLLNRH